MKRSHCEQRLQQTRFWEVQVKCCFTWKVYLGPWEGESKWAGVAPSVTGEGAVGVFGVKEVWTRVSRRERSLQKVDKGGDGNGGGISLKVAEMASDDLLDVNAGGMV
eukprot:g32054.t1